MSPFWIPIMAMMIPITAIVGGTVVGPLVKLRQRRLELEAQGGGSEAARLAAHWAERSERLEERVRVLERIVTDRGLTLGEEIDRLRQPRLEPRPDPRPDRVGEERR